MQIRSTIAAIEDELRFVGTAERAAGEKRYLKSDLEFLGATVPQVRKQTRRWLADHPDLDRDSVVRLSRALWRRRIHELRTFGVELLIARVELLEADDLVTVEWILRRANTWAHVDAVAVHVAGPLIDLDSHLESDLDRWAADENFWLRRSALLSHLLALRCGKGDWGRFGRYAGLMMAEKEFFIRKAIGWVLREAAKATPDRVIAFLEMHLDEISGLSLREATKRLQPVERDRLLATYRSQRGS